MYKNLTLFIDPFILFSAHTRSWLIRFKQRKLLYLIVLVLYSVINSVVLSFFSSIIHFFIISAFYGLIFKEPFELYYYFLMFFLALQVIFIIALKNKTSTMYPEVAMKIIWLFELIHKRSYITRFVILFCTMYFSIVFLLFKISHITDIVTTTGFLSLIISYIATSQILYFVPRKRLKLYIYRLLFNLTTSIIIFYLGLIVLVNKSDISELVFGLILLGISTGNAAIQLTIKIKDVYNQYTNEQHQIINSKLNILNTKYNAKELINIFRAIRVGLYIIHKKKRALQFFSLLSLCLISLSLIFLLQNKLQGAEIRFEPLFENFSSPEKAKKVFSIIIFGLIQAGFILHFIIKNKKKKFVDYLLLSSKVAFFSSSSLLIASTFHDIPSEAISFKLGLASFIVSIIIGLILLLLNKLGNYLMSKKTKVRVKKIE